MSLENLRSIFAPTEGGSDFVAESENSIFIDSSGFHFQDHSLLDDGFTDNVLNFSINRPRDKFDTKLFNEPPQPTIFIATNPTDFSTAVGNNESVFTPKNLPFAGRSFMDDLSWEKLYENDHTPLNNPQHKGISSISYPNVSRDNLKIGKRDHVIGERYGFNRGDEPYIVSEIGDRGRLKNAGGRSVPIIRALVDGSRIINYLTSAHGLAFIAKQNANIPIKNTVIRRGSSLMRVPQRYGVVYNPLSSVLATSGRLLGQGIPNVLFRRQGSGGSDAIAEGLRGWENFKPGISTSGVRPETKAANRAESRIEADARRERISDLLGNRGDNVYGAGKPNGVDFSIHDTFNKYGNEGGTGGGGFGAQLQNALSNLNPFEGTTVPKTITGDKMTLSSILSGETLDDVLEDDFFTSDEFEVLPDVDSEKEGMPFYFKDLRTNEYILFRAYIEGLTENISPSYAPHMYIGRSEPVWTYERAEREISFTLKLIAQTSSELTSIYKKMDKLTSLCYPEHISDDYGNRMKPPLTRLRMGEYFGKTNKELMGYIKSISYAVDNSSTYETEVGFRVPKHVMATIGYQVIHDKVPNIDTKFYGINQ